MNIREIDGLDELRAVEALQKHVWSVTDLEVLPAIHMIAARAVGAILVGAFDGAELIGFVYGFPGFEGEHRVIHSDMLAVDQRYRDRGVGRALKRAQRDAALARGIDRITWTFDPLQPRNAYLNLTVLGATADRYLRDFYGATSSPLHRHGTDRLWVTWQLHSKGERSGNTTRIEIPTDVAALPDEDVSRWRIDTREAFEKAFANGFVASGFERGATTCAYVLTSSSEHQ